MAKVKNIIFDLGGVIINVDDSYTMSAFSKLGIANPRQIFTIEKQADLCDKLEVGEITPEYFCEQLLKLSANKVSHKDILDAWNAMVLDIPQHRIEMLKDVGKKYKIYLLSNTNPMHLHYINNVMLKNYNLMLEDLFIKTYYSFEVGLRKADARIFQHILHDNSLAAAETLLIDDLASNILVAKDLGIKTLHVARNRFDVRELFEAAAH